MTAITVIAVVVLALAAATIAARRMGYSGIGGDTVVRCRAGHLFTTLWVPGASLKSVRLGTNQVPVLSGRKALDPRDPVRESELTDEEREFALQHHDARVP
jgi:hypothetical protein